MKRRHKVYLRMNLISLAFVAISFISVTLAWFAYSGLSTVQTEVNVKAWYIELEKDGEQVSNDIVVSLDDIYPGMDSVNETVKIKNLGDSDAQISYSIVSARILDNPKDNYESGDGMTTEYIEDKLSHAYPFQININLNKNYALAKTGESVFSISVSWPLDSGQDDLDSDWGLSAYEFKKNEDLLASQDKSYEIRPSIKILLSVKAEQYVTTDDSQDINYNLGEEILFNVTTNSICKESVEGCVVTHVIDTKNSISSKTVSLLPDVNMNYEKSNFDNYSKDSAPSIQGWNVSTRYLTVLDVLNIISLDITDSFLVRPNLSRAIIGNLTYEGSLQKELLKATLSGGHYEFKNKFSYLRSDECYWVNGEFDLTHAFAIANVDQNISKLYGELKTSDCKIIPVIVLTK